MTQRIRVFVMGLGLAMVSITAWTAEKPESQPRLLTVQGQGKASAVPDIAVISVEVSQEGRELDPVLTDVRRRMEKIQAEIKAQGIAEKDVRTDLFQVRPKLEHDKRGNAQRVGYVVSNRVSVKIRELKKTGRVLSAVVDAGATTVNGPDFEIDNPSEVERLALAAATRDARTKAQAVAEAAGVKLGRIQNINPQSVGWPSPRSRFAGRAMMMAEAAAPPEEPISAGEQTLTAYVTISFDID